MRNGEQDWLAEAEVEDKLGKAGQVEGTHALFPNRESLMRFFFTDEIFELRDSIAPSNLLQE